MFVGGCLYMDKCKIEYFWLDLLLVGLFWVTMTVVILCIFQVADFYMWFWIGLVWLMFRREDYSRYLHRFFLRKLCLFCICTEAYVGRPYFWCCGHGLSRFSWKMCQILGEWVCACICTWTVISLAGTGPGASVFEARGRKELNDLFSFCSRWVVLPFFAAWRDAKESILLSFPIWGWRTANTGVCRSNTGPLEFVCQIVFWLYKVFQLIWQFFYWWEQCALSSLASSLPQHQGICNFQYKLGYLCLFSVQ